MALDSKKTLSPNEEQRRIMKDVQRILGEHEEDIMLMQARRFCISYEYAPESMPYL